MPRSTLLAHRTATALWSGVVRAHLDAMVCAADAPVRGLVVGPAGSGKSTALHTIESALREQGRAVVRLRRGTDVDAVDADAALLVDDAHALDADTLDAVARRAQDADAGLVVAGRPWPPAGALSAIAQELEASHPAIVLGLVTVADAVRSADVPTTCAEDLLRLSGGLTWLTNEALSAHDDMCLGALTPHAADHDAIVEALQEQIAHRLHGLDPQARQAVEQVCVAIAGPAPSDDAITAGYAAGLLLRNGEPAPLVRAAVRATIPPERVARLLAAGGTVDAGGAALARGVHDPALAAALLRQADDAAATDPQRALDLFDRAGAAGADAVATALGRARAQWTAGLLDAAGAELDALPRLGDATMRAEAGALTGAIWAARGLMDEAHTAYVSADAGGALDEHALVAGIAVGAPGDRPDADDGGIPHAPASARDVALRLLGRGVGASLRADSAAGLGDLVRAADAWTASGSAGPVPEVPAVVAALAALHAGDLDAAGGLLDAALRDGHAGAWAQPRLRLWRAWVDLQWQRPQEAAAALQAVARTPLHPRDRLLADALRVGLARRYADAPELVSVWRAARESLLRARFDLFALLPLTEYAVAAARVGDADRVRAPLADALTLLQRLGSPPLWSAHVHWAGIQQGILLSRPDALRPHARALVAASGHSRVAATMARAGRVWTSVLAGDVDADDVEDAALALADIGLAWDAARLAGHGAGRTDDRRVISRLLACARQLHPPQSLHVADASPAQPPAEAAMALSAREREVAVLVVQGMTYAEIGETIFISPRTAEHHIARIRRRLGATSRSDLIAKLRIAMDTAETASRPYRQTADTSPDTESTR